MAATWDLADILGQTVELDQGELLLLDWVLCGASRLIPNADLEILISWHDVRLAIWAKLGQINTPPHQTVPLSLTEGEAKALLALVPTTFRWATGPDCGYSLKTKLHTFLRGESHDDQDKAHDQAGDGTPGGAAA